MTPHQYICECGHTEMRWHPDQCLPCQEKRYSPYHTCPLYQFFWEQDKKAIAMGLRLVLDTDRP